MSFGTLSRQSLREALRDVLAEALPDADYVSHIRLDAVPQGIAHRGYALEGFRSRDDASRKDRGSALLKRHTVRLRYAHRIGHDVETDRAQAEADLDAIERALRNSSAPQTADFDVVDFESDETVHASGEWLLVDVSLDVLCNFRLRDPAAVAVASE